MTLQEQVRTLQAIKNLLEVMLKETRADYVKEQRDTRRKIVELRPELRREGSSILARPN